MVACTCPSCLNSFAVATSSLGTSVQCPVCTATVTAQATTDPEAAANTDQTSGQHEGTPPSINTQKASSVPPVQTPRKKTDRRQIGKTIQEHSSQVEIPSTKLRKKRDLVTTSEVLTTRKTSLSEETPEYQLPPAEEEKNRKKSTWPVWLLITGTILAILGVFMYIRGEDLEKKASTSINLADLFVDHEADFSRDQDEALMREIAAKTEQYQNITRQRNKEDHDSQIIINHITDALNTLALYCMAGSDEERLNYVLNPDEVRNKMRHWGKYAQYKRYLPQEAGTTSKDGDLLQMSVLMDDNTVHPAVFLYDHPSKKWQLDWEAWEGYSPVLPEDLISHKPSTPTPVRVTLSMSALYKTPFLANNNQENYKQAAYVSFQLTFPNGERLNAYADRYSPLALQLIKLLYNGPIRACLAIHYPPELPDNSAVIIDQLFHTGWMSNSTRKLLPQENTPATKQGTP